MKPGDMIRYHAAGAQGGDTTPGLDGALYTDRIPDQAIGVVTRTGNMLSSVCADFGDVIGEWWLRRGYYSLETSVDDAGPWMRALIASATAMKARICMPFRTPDLRLELGIRYANGHREKVSVPVDKGVAGAAKRLFIQESLFDRLKMGPGYRILADEIMGNRDFSYQTLFPVGVFKVGEMAAFRPTYTEKPRKWTHAYGVQVGGSMLNLPIQSGGFAFHERPSDQPWSARHIAHIIRAGGEVDHLEGYGDEVIITLPDTFPLVLCDH